MNNKAFALIVLVTNVTASVMLTLCAYSLDNVPAVGVIFVAFFLFTIAWEALEELL